MLNNRQLFEVSLDRIHPDPNQPRKYFEEEALLELAESIKKNKGVIQPIVIRNHPEFQSDFMIVSGERRWRASRIAGFQTIEALIMPLQSDCEDEGYDVEFVQMAENIHRRDLNPVEKAEFIQKQIDSLREKGVDSPIDILSKKYGYHSSWFSKNTAILRLSEEVRCLARSGSVRDVATLRKIDKLSPKLRYKAIETAKRGGNLKDFFKSPGKEKEENLGDSESILEKQRLKHNHLDESSADRRKSNEKFKIGSLTREASIKVMLNMNYLNEKGLLIDDLREMESVSFQVIVNEFKRWIHDIHQ